MANNNSISNDAILKGALKGEAVAINGQPARVYVDVMDGAGLFLATNAKARTGSWKYQYASPVSKKRTKGTLGKVWLDQDGNIRGMTVKEARLAHQAAAEQVAAGLCPNEEQRKGEAAADAEKAAADELARDTAERARHNLPAKDSFKDVCLALAKVNATRHTESYQYNREKVLERWVYPTIGSKHIATVTEDDVTKIDKLLVDEGKLQTLVKARRFMYQAFAFAMLPSNKLRPVSLGNPVFKQDTLWDELESTPHPALDDPREIGEMLRAVRGWVPNMTNSKSVDTYTIRNAVLFLAYTGQRTHMVREARKEHFDLAAGTWTIPAVMMKGELLKKRKKGKKPHVVFLSRQVIAILTEQFTSHPESPMVFTGMGRTKDGLISRDSLRRFLERLGYDGKNGKHVPHGFRSVWRTTGEEHAGINPLFLERGLAHKHATAGLDTHAAVTKMLTGGMPGVYARTKWEQQQIEAYQAFADYLDDISRPVLALVA